MRMWTCPECSITAPVLVWPVRCSCGFKDNGDSQAEVRRLAAKGSPPDFIRTPCWEAQQRRDACAGCPKFNAVSDRCSLIDLGCHTTWMRAVGQTRGKCPLDRWPRFESPYITTADMSRLAIEVASRLPGNISRVVGVPRSGMLPASMLATHLHVPLYSLRDGRLNPVGGGSRMQHHQERAGQTLLVDDTVASGAALEQVHGNSDVADAITLGMYCNPQARRKPDIIGRDLELPHLLEWNLFSCGYVGSIGFDLDGVICRNPPHSEQPLYLPRHLPAKVIVTARYEKKRAETEAWLRWWGVRYSELLMLPDDAASDLTTVVLHKVNGVKLTDCEFYIESEVGIAHEMRKYGVRVLCPEEGWLK